eukprot:g21821.t1
MSSTDSKSKPGRVSVVWVVAEWSLDDALPFFQYRMVERGANDAPKLSQSNLNQKLYNGRVSHRTSTKGAAKPAIPASVETVYQCEHWR